MMARLKDAAQGVIDFLASWTTVFCAWLAETVLVFGYPGIIFLMAVESSLIPFPSELVMPPAGFQIHEGNMSWLPVILSGIAGSLLGALFNYFFALHFGRPFLLRYGKYFFLKPEHLERAECFFARHGEIATLVGRLIPVIRQFVSLPAGLSRMPLGRFCFFTGLGAGIWVVVLTVIGWLVGRERDLLNYYMKSASLWVLGLAGLMVFVYVKMYRRKRNACSSPDDEVEG